MSRKQVERQESIYSITREGKKQLRAKEKEWKEYAGAVRNVLGGVCFG